MPNALSMIEKLAADARPINDADWGSDRQINAINLFFYHAECERPDAFGEDFETYCLKATDEEMIDECLRRLRASA
jgi:hypothetical protein